jgi:hypothetical protein
MSLGLSLLLATEGCLLAATFGFRRIHRCERMVLAIPGFALAALLVEQSTSRDPHADRR